MYTLWSTVSHFSYFSNKFIPKNCNADKLLLGIKFSLNFLTTLPFVKKDVLSQYFIYTFVSASLIDHIKQSLKPGFTNSPKFCFSVLHYCHDHSKPMVSRSSLLFWWSKDFEVTTNSHQWKIILDKMDLTSLFIFSFLQIFSLNGISIFRQGLGWTKIYLLNTNLCKQLIDF